jgi:CRP/FNR family cyclic AMP-dependent transcriptional regulator
VLRIAMFRRRTCPCDRFYLLSSLDLRLARKPYRPAEAPAASMHSFGRFWVIMASQRTSASLETLKFKVAARAGKPESPFDPKEFLSKIGKGRSIAKYRTSEIIFSQGDQADSVFFIDAGKVKLTVISEQGKEAVVALLGKGDFCGEGCLTGQPKRIATAAAMMDCEVMQLQKGEIIRVLHDEPAFSELFISYVLSRTIRVEADLIDQLFNSSEKRLARALLLLANFGKEGRPEPILAKVSQETLAEMIGTTRSRVSFFMNKFRQLGFNEYNGSLNVHSSLLNVLLHDQPQLRNQSEASAEDM